MKKKHNKCRSNSPDDESQPQNAPRKQGAKGTISRSEKPLAIPNGGNISSKKKGSKSKKNSESKRNQVTPIDAVDELVAAQKDYALLKEGYRNSKYELLAIAATNAQRISSDKEAYDKFRGHPYWVKVRPTENIYLDSMKFLMKARTKAARKLASKYAICAEYMINNHNVERDNFALMIKEMGGIQNICSMAAGGDRQENTPDLANGGSGVTMCSDRRFPFVFKEKQIKKLEVLDVGERARITIRARENKSLEVVRFIRLKQE